MADNKTDKMSRKERRYEERVEQIRQEDPGFIPPVHEPRQRRQGASLWVWIGVAVLILLLIVWLSIAMFTGDTDVNMIQGLLMR